MGADLLEVLQGGFHLLGEVDGEPPVRAMATDIICSPIQARGRKER